MATPTAIVAYLTLFVAVGFLFLFVNLLVGWLLRPKLPNNEKLEVYECGEPAIGSSFVQFDLRFYVVALLFIIFDVEVAFFFPWGTVFGKAVQLSSPDMQVVATDVDESIRLSPQATTRLGELVIVKPELADFAGEVGVRSTAQKIALTSLADIGVFFAVLLVGFAYVWKRGDLDWVRAVTSQQGDVVERAPPQASTPVARPAGSILSA